MALPRLFDILVLPSRPTRFGLKHPLGFDQHIGVQGVELPDNLAGLLDVGRLVLADRDKVGAAEGDVRGLADRVAQESVGHRLAEVVLGSLGLDGRVVRELLNRNEVRVDDRKFGDLRDHRLDKQRGLGRVHAAGEVVHRHIQHVLVQPLRVVEVGRQHLDVGEDDERVVLVLQLHPVGNRADIVAQMQRPGRPVAGQNPLLFHSADYIGH